MVIYSSVERELSGYGRVVELVDSLDSGSSVHCGRAGSSPASRTIEKHRNRKISVLFSNFSPLFSPFLFCSKSAARSAQYHNNLIAFHSIAHSSLILSYQMSDESQKLRRKSGGGWSTDGSFVTVFADRMDLRTGFVRNLQVPPRAP